MLKVTLTFLTFLTFQLMPAVLASMVMRKTCLVHLQVMNRQEWDS